MASIWKILTNNFSVKNMPVIKLTSAHAGKLMHLFDSDKYTGAEIFSNFAKDSDDFRSTMYNMYCSTYLSGLSNFHSMGYLDHDTDRILSLITFYESIEEPAWYHGFYMGCDTDNRLSEVFDEVIIYNESHHRNKFYTLVHFNDGTEVSLPYYCDTSSFVRYDYVDEYMVPAKTKCVYTNTWELLYKRVLFPEDTVVRCNFLKQEYRNITPIGGNL